MIKKDFFVKFLLFGAVAVLTSLIWTESLFYSQNNIIFNSHWETYKKNFYASGANAIYSLLSRTLVANNKLITNKNLGHQINFTKELFKPKQILYKVRLTPNSYIDVLFNANESETDGLRFSTVPGISPFFYKANLKGEFLKKHQLNTASLNMNQAVELELREQEEKILAYADGELLGSLERGFSKAKIGFYTSLDGVIIEKVSFIDSIGKTIVLSFARDYEWWDFFVSNFLIVMIFVILINGPYLKFNYQRSLKMVAFLFGSGLIWFSFDYFYYSKIPKVWNFKQHVFVNELTSKWDTERLRYLFFSEWYSALDGEVATEEVLKVRSAYTSIPGIRLCQKTGCRFFDSEVINNKNRPSDYRIAHVGGSFSDYAGITVLEDSFFDHFSQRILNKKPSAEIANLVFSGAIFNLKKEEIEKSIEQYRPDLIVFSLFLDFPDYEPFLSSLEKWKAAGIPVVYYFPLSERANEITDSNGNAFTPEFIKGRRRKQFWSELKSRNGLSFLDTNKIIQDQKLKTLGWVWWDSNHMTPFAQAFVADIIANFVLKSME